MTRATWLRRAWLAGSAKRLHLWRELGLTLHEPLNREIRPLGRKSRKRLTLIFAYPLPSQVKSRRTSLKRGQLLSPPRHCGFAAALPRERGCGEVARDDDAERCEDASSSPDEAVMRDEQAGLND